MVKLGSSASPRGPAKVAAEPTPSAPPAAPFPASVVTAALATSMRRMALLFPVPVQPQLSATKSSPLGCHAALVGALNCAAAPSPSTKPGAPLPAKAATVALARLTERMRLPSCSTM